MTDIGNDNKNDALLKFKDDFIGELYKIEGDNVADFTKIWEWFTPKKEWEIFCGQQEKQLGSNIFRIADKWKRNHNLNRD